MGTDDDRRSPFLLGHLHDFREGDADLDPGLDRDPLSAEPLGDLGDFLFGLGQHLLFDVDGHQGAVTGHGPRDHVDLAPVNDVEDDHLLRTVLPHRFDVVDAFFRDFREVGWIEKFIQHEGSPFGGA